MTTTSDDGDQTSAGSYTDMQIHDDELPEELRPENDLDLNATSRPPGAAGDPGDPGADAQPEQASESTESESDGDAAASDAQPA